MREWTDTHESDLGECETCGLSTTCDYCEEIHWQLRVLQNAASERHAFCDDCADRLLQPAPAPADGAEKEEER